MEPRETWAAIKGEETLMTSGSDPDFPEYECEECKRRTKLSRPSDVAPNCENLECKRFGEPMRELV